MIEQCPNCKQWLYFPYPGGGMQCVNNQCNASTINFLLPPVAKPAKGKRKPKAPAKRSVVTRCPIVGK